MEKKNDNENEEKGYRVKVYKLTESGEWIDQGTGFIRIYTKQINSTLKEYYFNCVPEESGKPSKSSKPQTKNVILNTRVVMDDIYELQGESLIVWNDYNLTQDLAISFQSTEDCCDMWDEIRKIQGREKDSEFRINENKRNQKKQEEDDEDEYVQDDSFLMDDDTNVEITLEKPTVNLKTLKEILRKFDGYHVSRPTIKKSVIAKIISEDAIYVKQVYKCFHDLEDVGDTEGLGLLNRIFQKIILLNDPDLLNILFSKKNVLDSVGILEYDFEISSNPQNHRKFLNEQRKFIQVFDFSNDKDLLDLIFKSYNLQYLKETVLPRVLDDQTFGTVQGMLTITNFTIVQQILQKKKTLKNLLIALSNFETKELTVRHNISFLDELIILVKNVSNMHVRKQFFENLIEFGLLDSLAVTLVYKNDRIVRQKASNILLSIVTYQPMLMRTEIVKRCQHKVFKMTSFFPADFQDQSKNSKNDPTDTNPKKEKREKKLDFLTNMIKAITEDSELSVQDSVSDALRCLLDFDLDNIGTYSDDFDTKSDFLNIFYENYILQLIQPFNTLSESKQQFQINHSTLSLSSKTVFVHVLDLLSFCIQSHGRRSKTFVLEKNVLSLILNQLNNPIFSTPTKLGVIRLFKHCIELSDVHMNRRIIDKNLFSSIFVLWEKNDAKYNMISSSLISLLDLVARGSSNILVTYVFDNFKSIIEKNCDEIDSFSKIKLKYAKLNQNKKKKTDKKIVRDNKKNLKKRKIEQIYDSKEEKEQEEPTQKRKKKL